MRVSLVAMILLFALGACRQPNRAAAAVSPTPTPTATPDADAADEDDDVDLETQACHGGLNSNVIYVHPEGSDAGAGTIDDPLLTIQAGIDAADAAYATAEVHVAEGTYRTAAQVTLARGISVYGGYSAEDWNDCDILRHETVIEDTRASGGTSNYPLAAVFLNSTGDDLVFEGFTILAGSGTYSAGVHVYQGYHYTFQYNTVHAGAGATRSQGFYLFMDILTTAVVDHNKVYAGTGASAYGIYQITSSATITNNTVYGESGASNFGIYSQSSTGCSIRGNTVHGGAGVHSYGIYSSSAGCTIRENVANGGSGSTDSTGIYILAYSAPYATVRENTATGGSGATSTGIFLSSPSQVYGNRVSGGTGATLARGVMVNSDEPTVYNNVIFGGVSDADTYGIYINNPVSPFFYNNTVDGGIAGSTSGKKSVGLYLNGIDSPEFKNNIFSASGGTLRYCAYENLASMGYDPLLMNNAFYNCPTAVMWDVYQNCTANHDGDADNHTCDAEDLNSFFSGSGNFAATPVYADAAGADDDLTSIADNDYRLDDSSPASIRTGGIDGTSGFGFTTDFLGTARTGSSGTGWSVGAFEKD